jgi:hypothetical protein
MATLEEFFNAEDEDDMDIAFEEDEEEEDMGTWRHLLGEEMGDVNVVDSPVDEVLFESTKKGSGFHHK